MWLENFKEKKTLPPYGWTHFKVIEVDFPLENLGHSMKNVKQLGLGFFLL